MSDLSALIARVEAETGPDRELDEAVALTLNIYVRERRGKDRQYWFYKVGGNDYERRSTHRYAGSDGLPFYTSSIDSALTLLPERCGWIVSNGRVWHDEPLGGARITSLDGDTMIAEAEAATPCLALLAAILRARQAPQSGQAQTEARGCTVTSESEPSTSDTAPLDFSTVEIGRDFYFTWPNGVPKTSPELLALLERAKNHVMTPEEVYEQRRSFVRGMCPSNRDYTEWCADVDRIIPPLPGPSDTRPADVTVTPRVIDNDRDEIVVTLNGNELRGWSYSTEHERRVRMLCAREFVEGFHAGRQP